MTLGKLASPPELLFPRPTIMRSSSLSCGLDDIIISLQAVTSTCVRGSLKSGSTMQHGVTRSHA